MLNFISKYSATALVALVRCHAWEHQHANLVPPIHFHITAEAVQNLPISGLEAQFASEQK